MNDLTQVFGLGWRSSGRVEVLWPGGVRNRFYNAGAGELVLPEIPCSHDTLEPLGAYTECVEGAVAEYVAAEVVRPAMGRRLVRGAMRAYHASR